MAQLEKIHIMLMGTITARNKMYINEKEQNESASASNETPSSVVELSLPSNSEFSESEDKM